MTRWTTALLIAPGDYLAGIRFIVGSTHYAVSLICAILLISLLANRAVVAEFSPVLTQPKIVMHTEQPVLPLTDPTGNLPVFARLFGSCSPGQTAVSLKLTFTDSQPHKLVMIDPFGARQECKRGSPTTVEAPTANGRWLWENQLRIEDDPAQSLPGPTPSSATASLDKPHIEVALDGGTSQVLTFDLGEVWLLIGARTSERRPTRRCHLS